MKEKLLVGMQSGGGWYDHDNDELGMQRAKACGIEAIDYGMDRYFNPDKFKNGERFPLCDLPLEDFIKHFEPLKKAVSIALERFPMYAVKIKEGLFWHYFDKNDGIPLVRKESSNLFDTINTLEHDKFMFCVEYYERRVSLEMFHALSDGTGGMEFFKAIIYYYLRLVGHDIKNDGSILTNEYEKLNDESQDSFGYNYDENKKQS